MDARAFLEIERQLPIGRRHHPHRDRRAQCDIGDQQCPDGAVDRDGRRQERKAPEKADRQHHAGHHPGQPGQHVDQLPAAPASARRDIGDDGAEYHGGGRAAEAEQEGVAEGPPHVVVRQHRAIVIEREHVPFVETEEAEERSQQQLPDRQHHADHEERRAQREGHPAPGAEIDHARRITLAGDGLEALAAQQPPLPQHQQEHQPHDDEAERAGELIVRDRLVVDGIVDLRGHHLDLRGRSEEQRRFEALQPADKAEQEGGHHRRQHQREGHTPKSPPLRRAAHPAGLFQRRIHRAEGLDDEQEQERRRILQHVPDHSAVGVDIDQRLRGAAEPLPGEVDDADLRIAQHAPCHRGEDRRHEERQRDQHLQRAARRCVGPRDDPSEQHRKRQRGHRLDQRDPDGVAENLRRLPGEDLPIARQVERAGNPGRRGVQAAVEQHRQRIERQEREQQRETDQRQAARQLAVAQARQLGGRRDGRAVDAMRGQQGHVATPGGAAACCRAGPATRREARWPGGRCDARTTGSCGALLIKFSGQFHHRRALLQRRRAHQLGVRERLGVVTGLLGNTLDNRQHPAVGIGQLRGLLEEMVDQEPRRIGMRRILQQGELHHGVGSSLLRDDDLDGQPLEVGREGEVLRDVDRIFATRDTARVVAQIAAEHRLLLRELLVESRPHLLLQNGEHGVAAAERAHVVGQDLSLPSGIGEIVPALRLVLRLDQPGVDENSHWLHIGGNAEFGRLERLAQVRRIGNGADFLHVIAGLDLLLEHGRGDDFGIAQEPSRRLLGPHPLRKLARPQIQAFHLDAVFGLEGLEHRKVIRRAQRHAVDDDLALFLPGLDDGGPVRGLRRGRRQRARK